MKPMKKCRIKARILAGDSNPKPPVKLHLLITRSTGDVERYQLGEVPDLRYAIDYRLKLAKVRVPKRLGSAWKEAA